MLATDRVQEHYQDKLQPLTQATAIKDTNLAIARAVGKPALILAR
jgi:hypothetical protein